MHTSVNHSEAGACGMQAAAARGGDDDVTTSKRVVKGGAVKQFSISDPEAIKLEAAIVLKPPYRAS